jgi:signal transduction histidine kinase
VRQQIVGLVAAVASLILAALLVPMAVLIERFAFEDALAAASLEVHATETVVSFRERADLVTFVDIINANDDGRRTTVLFSDGDAIGPDKQVTDDVEQARRTGQAISNDTELGAEILTPVTLGDRPGDTENGDATADRDTVVIRVLIPAGAAPREVLLSWGIIAVLGAALLAIGILVADRVARRHLRPVLALARTAAELEAGNLGSRAAISGPSELRDVGHALNRLAARIRELIAAERESAADLSHRLRTPIAALRLEAERIADPGDRHRMAGGIDAVSRALDHVIREARRPVREGLGASCDAAAVIRDRTEFWRVLAEDQHRTMRVHIPEGAVPVKVSELDLTAAVDALLDNVLAHTAEGVPFDVVLRSAHATGVDAVLMISDRGAGFPHGSAVLDRGQSPAGSTGLGLDIARRTAEASGGRLVVENPPGGGARVILDLGPPDSERGPRAPAVRRTITTGP